MASGLGPGQGCASKSGVGIVPGGAVKLCVAKFPADDPLSRPMATVRLAMRRLFGAKARVPNQLRAHPRSGAQEERPRQKLLGRVQIGAGVHAPKSVDTRWTPDQKTERPLSRPTCNILFSLGKMERAKGFEPSTPTLARLCSTPELRPLERSREKCAAEVRRRLLAAVIGLGKGLCRTLGRARVDPT